MQLLQLRRHGAVGLLLADTAVGPESWQANGHVLGASIEGGPEPLALLDEDRLPGRNLELLALAVVEDHASLEHTHPLVIVKRQPRFASSLAHANERDADPVGLGGH